jgi:hypothetical protein
LYRTHRVALPTKVRGPSGRPPCRAACLTTSLAKNDQPQKRRLAAAHHKRQITAAWPKSAVSPPNKRAS